MLKKSISLILVLILTFSLTGCERVKELFTLEQTTSAPAATSDVTIIPGCSIVDVAEKLEEANICTKESFFEACKSVPEGYEKMFSGIENSDGYLFAIEGYIPPNTYNMYQNRDGEYALKYFLNETDKIISSFHGPDGKTAYEQADALNLSMFEVMTLASIIQFEANLGSTDEDATIMKQVSSVFHNRLKNTKDYPYLGSNATRKYVEIKVKSYIEENSLDYDKYFKGYNTDSEYDLKTKGLPVGPVANCTPTAIKAALWPDTTGYYYFFTDIDNGFHFYTNLKDFQYEWNTKYKH